MKSLLKRRLLHDVNTELGLIHDQSMVQRQGDIPPSGVEKPKRPCPSQILKTLVKFICGQVQTL